MISRGCRDIFASSVQDVDFTSPSGCSVSGDGHPGQRGQLLRLQTAGGGSQGARGQHGLPARGLRLHRI